MDQVPKSAGTSNPPPDPAAEMALAMLRARILDAKTDELSVPREDLP
jgi:hypothetical protein